MSRYLEADMVVRALVVTLVGLAAISSWVWWQRSSQEREAKRGAMPGCVARVGTEGRCQDQLDRHHRECFLYNNTPGGKSSPRVFDSAGYLDCVVQGGEPWLAAKRAAKARLRRESRP